MIRKTIKRIVSSKIFLLIVSIMASIGLWLYVVNVENTEIEQRITDIPVEFLGADDILADRQLLVSGGTEQTVSMTLRGRRNVVANLTRSDIRVTVDLTDIRTTGTVERVWNVSFPEGISDSDVYVLDKSPEYVTVQIDRMSSKEVEIRGVFDGNTVEGYKADPMEFSPETITVSGPEEIISQVEYAWVVVQRENLSKTVTAQVDYELRDAEGNTIESDEIVVDTEQVTVTIPVVMVKEVALTVELLEGGGATAQDAVIDCKPSSITLSGSAEILTALNQISLGRIDLASFERSTTMTFTIPIPNGVVNESGETEATVEVTLYGLESREIEVTATNFETINVTDGYVASPVQQSMVVTIRGPTAIIDQVGSHNIRVVVDASDMGDAVGMFTLEATVYVDGFSQVGAVGSYTVLMQLQREEDVAAQSTSIQGVGAR